MKPSSSLAGAGITALVLVLGSQIYSGLDERRLRLHADALAPPPSCDLDVQASPWAQHCQRLETVCLDQSAIVLWGAAFQEPDNGVAGELPKLLVSPNKVFTWPWLGQAGAAAGSGAGSDSASAGAVAAPSPAARRRAYQVQADYHRHLEAPRLRPATAQEPAAYLQRPSFSSCTVPVVLAATWRNNLWHVFDNAAIWFAMARRTPWRAHLKPLVLTPDGLGLTPMEAQLLPALGPLALQSFADASARLSNGSCDGSRTGQAQSFEGVEQRCFRNMFFCGTKIASGPAAPLTDTSLKAGVPRELFDWGQEVAAQQQQRGSEGQPLQPAQPLPWRRQGGGERRLRVVFLKRGSEGRQLLNAAELIERCRGWRLHRGTATLGASCREVTTSTLAEGVAAAREADVLVGMHGANMANSWLMRPGGSAVEIMPFGWVGSQPGALSLSGFNAGDPTSRLLWWVLNIADPALSSPGPEERRQAGSKRWWPRDRSARLPWAALEALLARIVELGGDRERYLQEWHKTGKYLLDVDSSGAVQPGRS